MSTLSHVATDPLPWDAARLATQLVATGPVQRWHAAYEDDLVAELPTSTPADVAAAAVRARRAQVAWTDRPIAERQKVLLDFHDAVLDRRDALADLLQYEGGKARLAAIEEVLHLALTARYYARTARQVLHPQRSSGMFPVLTRIDKTYVPRGLVGIIAPWNYPLSPTISDGLAAVVAGNAVLLKPDLQTPYAALAAVDPGLPRWSAAAAYLQEKAGDLETAARLYAVAARSAPNLAERDHLNRQAARLNHPPGG